MSSHPGRPLAVWFDPDWIAGVEPRDLHSLAKNLLTPAVDPCRRDFAALQDPYRYGQVVDLSNGVQLTELSSAAAILLPICHRHSYYAPSSAIAFARVCQAAATHARARNVPILIEGQTKDITCPRRQLPRIDAPFRYYNTSVLALHRSLPLAAEPYFIPDYLEKYFGGSDAPLASVSKPSVSFWGVAAPFQQRWSKTRIFDWIRYGLTVLDQVGVDSEALMRGLGSNMKHAHRARALASILATQPLKADVKIRPAGALVSGQYWLEKDDSEFRLGYFSALRDSLYSLCCRGTENYSIRFYETLCLGRIPVVVDTELRLPHDDVIDYQRHCLILPKRRAGRAGQAILEHFHSRTRDQLLRLQRQNRRLWLEWLTPAGFYRQIASTLGQI